MSRSFTATVLLLLLAASWAPVATASHWALYEEGIDRTAGATMEDDAQVINAPGNPLHGRANRVTEHGGTPGDGGLFLDARFANLAGTTAVYAGPGLVGRDILLPGTRELAAWYGEWLDYDGNAVIDDIHDTACEGGECGGDEFRWRGIASGHRNDVLIAFVLPQQAGTSIGGPRGGVPGILASYSDSTGYAWTELTDNTATTNAEQSWTGAGATNYDHGFLSSIQTLVAGRAPFVLGGQFRYDIDAPEALIDVDRYDAVSPDVEAMWNAVPGIHFEATDPVVAIYDDVAQVTNPIYAQAVSEGLAAAIFAIGVANDVLATANDPFLTYQHVQGPPDRREPDTVWDDSEGRALFGGVGDRLGSGNAYPGYQDGPHLYLDNLARTAWCGGAYVAVPSTSIEESQSLYCQSLPKLDAARARTLDPYGANVEGSRTSSHWLLFEARLFLWNDVNGDGHVGPVCSPADPDAFDAIANACRNPPYPWPHTAEFTEVIDVCESTYGKGGTFTVTPMGEWENAILVRHVAQTTRPVFDPESVEVLAGSDPVTLNWRNTCGGAYSTSVALTSDDAILFPAGGSRVPLMVDVTITMDAYKDAEQGIEVGAERVRDVDIVAAVL